MRLPLRFAALTLLTAASFLGPVPAAAQDRPCRQALALGLDVSGSVDGAEYRLQLDGLAAALTHPDVTDALLAAAGAPVTIAVYEWSGPTSQAVIIDWTEITDIEALAGVTARLRANKRTPADPSTALGTAMVVGARMLAQRAGCWKRTLDISGDGGSNTGPRPQDVDGDPALADITINALVIGPEVNDPSQVATGLLGYFETYVIRGPGAFAEHAEDFVAYEAAMVRKLLRELQGMVIGAVDPTGAAQPPRARPGTPVRPTGQATAPAFSRIPSPDPAPTPERTP